MITLQETGEIAAGNPAVDVFERLEIDYRRRGTQTFAEASVAWD